MIKFRYYLILIPIWINFLTGQVCCSLVGAVDQGGGTTATQWKVQWPSRFDNHHSVNWLAGLTSSYTSDNDLNIRYGNSLGIHTQVSHYIGQNSVGYIQIEGSWLQLQESLSFSKSSSKVQQLFLKSGIRHLLSKKWGFIFGELNFPQTPQFNNKDFPFRTGAVPVSTLGWINHFQTPWSIDYPFIFPDVSLSFSFGKNLKIQDNVYLDDAIYMHLSSTLFLSEIVSLSPFTTLQTQKLLAPLSPFESQRESRWLSEINIGVDITPIHSSWDWLHVRFSFPISSWSSNGIFPDGTEPVPRIAVSVITGGIFNR